MAAMRQKRPLAQLPTPDIRKHGVQWPDPTPSEGWEGRFFGLPKTIVIPAGARAEPEPSRIAPEAATALTSAASVG
jgi:hypothetical protein